MATFSAGLVDAKIAIYGLIEGMAVMTVSLLLFV
jgi:hypothetical protein